MWPIIAGAILSQMQQSHQQGMAAGQGNILSGGLAAYEGGPVAQVNMPMMQGADLLGALGSAYLKKRYGLEGAEQKDWGELFVQELASSPNPLGQTLAQFIFGKPSQPATPTPMQQVAPQHAAEQAAAQRQLLTNLRGG